MSYIEPATNSELNAVGHGTDPANVSVATRHLLIKALKDAAPAESGFSVYNVHQVLASAKKIATT